MTAPKKIVVYTGGLSYSVRKGIVEIDRAMADVSWLIVMHAPQKSAQQLVKSQWRNLRRNGLRWIPYQGADLWARLFDRNASDATPTDPDCPGSEYTLEAMRARPNLRWLHATDIHAETALQQVRAFAPDLGLSIAAPILKRTLFALPRLGTLNLHKGKLPDYRGMPPAFWELWNDESSVGCTVHWVDDKLDTGAIVRQTSVARAPFSTLRGLQLHLDEVGVELMRDAVKDALSGTPARQAQPAGGKTYRKPTLAQMAALQHKLDRLQPHKAASLPARLVKNPLRTLGVAGARMGLRRALAPRITVLLYHRVSDEVRDNLTVGIEQFDRQMALLRKHCTLLTLEQVMAAQAIAPSDLPLVAVTFDDGYLDNYQHAAPILLRHGIPSAFFVSTGIVSDNGRFPHDVRRGNAHIPLMNWDQLKQMRDWRFTIGSHSVNHIDCAAEPEATVRAELALSRDHLQQHLGLTELIFAYPYGGKQHMTPQRLELVKQAGYVGCLSAYGGTNIGSVDRFNVLRRGINWEFSDRAFLFECLGLR